LERKKRTVVWFLVEQKEIVGDLGFEKQIVLKNMIEFAP